MAISGGVVCPVCLKTVRDIVILHGDTYTAPSAAHYLCADCCGKLRPPHTCHMCRATLSDDKQVAYTVTMDDVGTRAVCNTVNVQYKAGVLTVLSFDDVEPCSQATQRVAAGAAANVAANVAAGSTEPNDEIVEIQSEPSVNGRGDSDSDSDVEIVNEVHNDVVVLLDDDSE